MNKPKIALIADVENWAFSNIARQMQNNLSANYDFEIFYFAKYKYNLASFMIDVLAREFDLIHFFWRKDVLDVFFYLERYANNYIELFIKTPITFSIYDHCYLDEISLKLYKIIFNYLSSGYTVSSHKLFDVYKNIASYYNPDMVIEDGVEP